MEITVTNVATRDTKGGQNEAQSGANVAALGGMRLRTRMKITNSKL